MTIGVRREWSNNRENTARNEDETNEYLGVHCRLHRPFTIPNSFVSTARLGIARVELPSRAMPDSKCSLLVLVHNSDVSFLDLRPLLTPRFIFRRPWRASRMNQNRSR